MAGAGYKAFADGDVLTAAQVQTFLQDQAVMKFADSSARTTGLGTAVAEGMVSYLADTDAVEVYDGSAWTAVGAEAKVVAVSYVNKTDTFTSASLAQDTFDDVTGLSFSHSLSDSSNLLVFGGFVTTTRGLGETMTRVTAGGSDILIGDTAGSRVSHHSGGRSDTGAVTFSLPIGGVYAPATTSSVTYQVQVGHTYSGATTLYVNRNTTDANSAGTPRGFSAFYAFEVTP